MKKYFFTIFIFFVNQSFCQEKFDENNLISEFQKINKEVSLSIVKIVEKDTTYGDNYLQITEYYNSSNKIVKKVKTDPSSALWMSGNRTEIFMSGKLIVAVNQDNGNTIWALEILTYDKEGNLTEKKQFDFLRIYKTNYSSFKEKTYFDSNGNSISDIKDAKRTKPYDSDLSYKTARNSHLAK